MANARPVATDFDSIFSAWQRAGRGRRSLLARLAPKPVPMVMLDGHTIGATAADFWPLKAVERRAAFLADPHRLPFGMFTTRAGSRTTAEYLCDAGDDDRDRVAILLLALKHDVCGRAGDVPASWRGDPWSFLKSCDALAHDHLAQREWFGGWHHRMTEAFPGSDSRLNEQMVPASPEAVVALLRAQLARLLRHYRLVRIVEAAGGASSAAKSEAARG